MPMPRVESSIGSRRQRPEAAARHSDMVSPRGRPPGPGVLAAEAAVRHDAGSPLRHSWLRSAGFFRLALPALIVLLGTVGYVLTSETISSDRDGAAARRVQVESIRTQGLLERARAYVAGLGNVMAGEPAPRPERFAQPVAGTTGGVRRSD